MISVDLFSLPLIVYITFPSTEIKLYESMISVDLLDKVGAAPTQDVAVHLEMFATTHPRELAQGTPRVVPCRELAPNNYIIFIKL